MCVTGCVGCPGPTLIVVDHGNCVVDRCAVLSVSRRNAWPVTSAADDRMLCRGTTSCQFQSTVGLYESLINGARQDATGSLPIPFSANRQCYFVSGNCRHRCSSVDGEDLEDLTNASVRLLWSGGNISGSVHGSRLGGLAVSAPVAVGNSRGAVEGHRGNVFSGAGKFKRQGPKVPEQFLSFVSPAATSQAAGIPVDERHAPPSCAIK